MVKDWYVVWTERQRVGVVECQWRRLTFGGMSIIDTKKVEAMGFFLVGMVITAASHDIASSGFLIDKDRCVILDILPLASHRYRTDGGQE